MKFDNNEKVSHQRFFRNHIFKHSYLRLRNFPQRKHSKVNMLYYRNKKQLKTNKISKRKKMKIDKQRN